MVVVRALAADEVDLAAAVMAHAFADETTTRYFYRGTTEVRRPQLHTMFEIGLTGRVGLGQPAMGAFVNGELAGACILDLPNSEKWPEELIKRWDEFEAGLPAGTSERFEAYGTLKKLHRPTTAHAYLVAIGVGPEHQGQGVGRALLDEASARAGSSPVMLDTMESGNVAAYQRCGYCIFSEAVLGDQPIWFMKRDATHAPGRPAER